MPQAQSAMDRQAAGGGLGEYYSESDTRAPTWMVAGDKAAGRDSVRAGRCGAGRRLRRHGGRGALAR